MSLAPHQQRSSPFFDIQVRHCQLITPQDYLPQTCKPKEAPPSSASRPGSSNNDSRFNGSESSSLA
jgi:hypothetical protein